MKTLDDWVIAIWLYVLAGALTTAGMLVLGGLSTDCSDAQFLGVVVLWPAFVVKYLCIGVYLVLSAGLSLLF